MLKFVTMAKGKMSYWGQTVVCASENFLPKEGKGVSSHISMLILLIVLITNKLLPTLPFCSVSFHSFGRYEWRGRHEQRAWVPTFKCFFQTLLSIFCCFGGCYITSGNKLRCMVDGEKDFAVFQKWIFKATLIDFSALMFFKILIVSVKEIQVSPSWE